MDRTLRLGGLELVKQLGEGGMGVVYAARREGSHRVAVKVPSRRGPDPGALFAAFEKEVRAVAALDHPAIVRVHDLGVVGSDDASESGGALPAGTPYLVMQYADRGTLQDHAPAMGWSSVRAVLLSVLDGLAHAHARGVVHRDLKPTNVLLSSIPDAPSDRAARVLLSDFGLAHAMDSAIDPGSRSPSSVGGTPAYMAPEQIRHDWRSFGPPTDLYALGCVAFELVTGRPPFDVPHVPAALVAHLEAPPPPLRPRFSVPAGLQGWIHQLLQKHPADRPGCAADAARALLALECRSDTEAAGLLVVDATGAPASGSAATILATTGSATIAVRATTVLLDAGVGPASLRPSEAPAAPDAFEVPASWVVPADEARTPDGALGLGLFGLRQIPFIGREPERDRLWQLLGDAAFEKSVRAVVVSGEAGTGTTSLTDWLGQRAMELGVAAVLRATHDSAQGRHAGIGPCLARHFRLVDLDAREARERLARDLGAQIPGREVLELVAAMGIDAAEASGRIRDPVHKHTVLRRALETLAVRRPVLLCCDDAHASAGTLAFVEHLLATKPDAAIVVVLVVDPAELARRPVERALLQTVEEHASCSRLDIGRLDARATRALVEHVLPLDPDLAATVHQASGGLPLLVVQTVTDWVARGALERRPNGFGSRGALVAPRELHELWSQRLQTFVELRSGRDAREVTERALEIAAVLGDVIDEDEWRQACALGGLTPPAELWPALWEARLVRRDDASWSFVSGDLARVLAARLERRGDAARVHAACARMLAERYDTLGCAERLARHHLAAGLLEEASTSLLAAATEAREGGEMQRCGAHLDRLDDTLDRLGEPHPSWRRLAALVSRAALLVVTRASGASEIVEQCAAVRSQLGPPRDASQHELASRCAQIGAIWAYQTGDFAAMAALAVDGREHARLAGSPSLEGDAAIYVGDAHFMLGALDEARACYEAAQATFEAIGDRRRTGKSLISLATTASSQGRHDDARRLGQEAIEHLEAAGAAIELAKAVSELGEHARRRGELDLAQQYYRHSRSLFSARGIDDIVVSFNLAITLLERRQHAEAREILHPLVERMVQRRDLAMAACAHAVLLACAAAERDAEAWERHASDAEAFIEASGVRYDDVAMAAEAAGDGAAPWRADAARAYAIALAQWAALDRADRVDAVERKVAALSAHARSTP